MKPHERAVIMETIHGWDHATLEENYMQQLDRAERLADELRRHQCAGDER